MNQRESGEFFHDLFMIFKKLNKLSISSTGSNSKAQHIFLHELSKAEKTHHMKDKFKGFQGDSFSLSFQAIFCSVFLTLSLFNSPAGVLKNQPQIGASRVTGHFEHLFWPQKTWQNHCSVWGEFIEKWLDWRVVEGYVCTIPR